MFDAPALILVALTFVLAGAVKGVIGLGLPTVSLGVLAALFDLSTSMALMLAPSLLTNLWQAASGGNARLIVARAWPFLLMATATIWLGAQALTRIDPALLSALLGALLLAYGALNLIGAGLQISARHEPWAGVSFGAVNGVLAGMTGSFTVPGVMYLQAIGLTRDQLVQAMGLLFAASTLALAFALGKARLIDAELALLSAAAVIPAIAGMIAGQRIRKQLSEARFRRVFFVAIGLLGLAIVLRATLRLASS